MWIIIAIIAIPAIKVNRNEVFFSTRLINAINELQYKVIKDDFPRADAEYMSGKPFFLPPEPLFSLVGSSAVQRVSRSSLCQERTYINAFNHELYIVSKFVKNAF